jgi:hypothetical protein
VLATACFVMWLMHGTQLHVLKLHVRKSSYNNLDNGSEVKLK